MTIPESVDLECLKLLQRLNRPFRAAGFREQSASRFQQREIDGVTAGRGH